MRKFLFILLLVPIVEIAFVLLSGKLIGAWWTIACILLTGALGIYLLRKEGLKAKQSFQQSMRQGQPPGFALIDGIFILVAGVLLILPGFLSDLLGILLILKPVRHVLRPLMIRWLKNKYQTSNVVVYTHDA